MKKLKIFDSFEEIKDYYFPNTILKDLEQTLWQKLELKLNQEHRLSIDKNNKTTGLIQIAISNNPFQEYSEKEIEEVIKKFYSARKYEINQAQSGEIIFVKKGKKDLSIIISKEGSSYNIDIKKVSKNHFHKYPSH